MRQSVTAFVLAAAVALTAPLSAWANVLDLPLQDRKLSAEELALQRYKRQRLTIRVEGESWHVVQGINVTIPDEQLLQLAGMTERVGEQKRKELIGGLMALAGGIAGVFGVLTLAQVVPMPDEARIGVGLGAVAGGITLAGLGEFFFPVMLPGDHFLTIDEARQAMEVVNQRLKIDLGLPPETPDR